MPAVSLRCLWTCFLIAEHLVPQCIDKHIARLLSRMQLVDSSIDAEVSRLLLQEKATVSQHHGSCLVEGSSAGLPSTYGTPAHPRFGDPDRVSWQSSRRRLVPVYKGC